MDSAKDFQTEEELKHEEATEDKENYETPKHSLIVDPFKSDESDTGSGRDSSSEDGSDDEDIQPIVPSIRLGHFDGVSTGEIDPKSARVEVADYTIRETLPPQQIKCSSERSEKKKVKKKDQVHMNTRALPNYAETYELEKFKRNALLILNHTEIDGLHPRSGTMVDEAALVQTFEKFNFDVIVRRNLTRRRLLKTVGEFTSSNDFTHYGCVAIAILTHGVTGGLLWAKDDKYSEMAIINRMQARGRPSLVTKPRILIIQACRGIKNTKAVAVFANTSVFEKDQEEVKPAYTLPAESDMLVIHSSYSGKASARHPTLGSWFIQTLCSRINQLSASHDLESILTYVKRDIGIHLNGMKENRKTKKDESFKQMPVSTSTLIRKLYFKRLQDHPETSVPDFNDATVRQSETDSSVPGTPMMLWRIAPCSCFLPHFEYIKKCLGFYVADYGEKQAIRYLKLANDLKLDDGAKASLTRIICEYLKDKTVGKIKYQCLYMADYDDDDENGTADPFMFPAVGKCDEK